MKSIKIFALAIAPIMSLSMMGQKLTFQSPVASMSASSPGGVIGRPSVSGVYFTAAGSSGPSVYGVTSQGGTPQHVLTYINGGGANQQFSNLSNPLYNGATIASTSTPGLTAMNGYLYLAFADVLGNSYIISSQDGINWTGPTINVSNGLPAGTQYNPSLTSDPSTGTIYAAYADGTTHTPIVCSWVPGNNPTCHSYTSLRTENFNPGIAFYDGLVYLGYADRGDNHCLYFYKYTPSTAAMTNWMPLGCSQQTSSGPSLAVYNNYLYIAYRSNDSSIKFTVEVSTDGNTINTANRMQPGFAVDGYPSLVNVGSALMGIYSRSNYLTTTLGN